MPWVSFTQPSDFPIRLPTQDFSFCSDVASDLIRLNLALVAGSYENREFSVSRPAKHAPTWARLGAFLRRRFAVPRMGCGWVAPLSSTFVQI